MILFIVIALAFVLVLFLYSCLVVSSKCSREEEKHEHTDNVQESDERR